IAIQFVLQSIVPSKEGEHVLYPHLFLAVLKGVLEDVLYPIVVLVIIHIMIYHSLHYLVLVLVCVHCLMVKWMSPAWQDGDAVCRDHIMPFIK
uniref:Uncharacterized protein n=1 Tax=Amphimedon queenslandica TaxID=400682 RepID=A0A1X7V475_AMPQE